MDYLISEKLSLVNQTTLSDHTALHCAAREGQTGVVRLLLTLPGLEIDQRDTQGRTPLFLAVSGQHAEVSHQLLQSGADLMSQDLSGYQIKDLARKSDVL